MTESIKVVLLNPHPSNEAMWGTLDVTDLLDAIERSNRITPLLVHHREDGGFVVLGGHRRLKAATVLAWEELDCEVHRGLTDEQEMAMIFLDNAANRKLDGAEKFKAAMSIMESMTGTKKSKIERLAKIIGTKFDSAKKIFRVVEQAKESPNPEAAIAEIAKKGPRSRSLSANIKPKPNKPTKKEGRASLPVEATNPERDVSEKKTAELEAKIAELEHIIARRSRRMIFLLDSFGGNEVWRDVLRYMDQVISLSDFNRHILAGEPHPDRRIRLDVWSEDLSESILQDYFVLYCNGNLIEKTNYVDVVEHEFAE